MRLHAFLSCRRILVASSLLLLTIPAFADNSPPARATLKGIEAIFVQVETLGPDAERDGLTKDQLLTDVEVRLRKAGIKVTSSPPGTRLYLSVHTLKDSFGLYAYGIKLEFHQAVLLERDLDVSLLATTWDVGLTGTVGVQKLRALRDRVGDLVDKFINAYLEQNPKR